MSIIDNYINTSIDILKKMHPDIDKKDIERIVNMQVKQNIKDPTVIMDNNVTKENHKVSLSRVCNWINDKNPVISGNGTFYMQPETLLAPTSHMLKQMKIGRKHVKKEMFAFGEDSYEYRKRDLMQLNLKVIMNADYGGSGAPMAAFYTEYSPPATTLMAQSIITTMAAFFEAYVGDNMKYYSINEFFDWIIAVKKKDFKIPKWITVPTITEVSDRIKSKFINYDSRDMKSIDLYIKSCNDYELTLIYYANNIKDFIRNHTNVHELLSGILSSLPLYEASESVIPDEFTDRFSSVKKYNDWVSEVMFLNPYNVPDCIKADLHQLVDLLTKFVYVEYITPDSIVKLNNHKRTTVLLVDTDSNVINSEIFVEFVLDTILPGQDFNRSRMYNEMICVNILANVLDSHVIDILDYYGRCHNMDADSRKELTMKNEFMFRKLFLMLKKKRYASSIVLREGNIMMPFKLEFKGLDFIKSGVTDEVKAIFGSMLEKYILFADEPNLRDLMRDIKSLEKGIRDNLREGGMQYLKPQVYKPMAAYKTRVDKNGKSISSAWSLPVFRGTTVWNLIYPEQKIYSMDSVKLVKLIATGIDDIEFMRDKYPNEYHNIVTKVFSSETPEISKTGIKVICLPGIIERIPEWMIDLIDYDITISNTMGAFRSVLDSLRIEGMEIKTPHGKARVISSIISI